MPVHCLGNVVQPQSLPSLSCVASCISARSASRTQRQPSTSNWCSFFWGGFCACKTICWQPIRSRLQGLAVCVCSWFMVGFLRALAHAMQCLQRNVSRSRRSLVDNCRGSLCIVLWYLLERIHMSIVPNPSPAPRFDKLPLMHPTAFRTQVWLSCYTDSYYKGINHIF